MAIQNYVSIRKSFAQNRLVIPKISTPPKGTTCIFTLLLHYNIGQVFIAVTLNGCI
jgi:hypothetical protein